VIKIVKAAGSEGAAIVADEVIEAMRARERDGAFDPSRSTRRRIEVGDSVRLISPFDGKTGLVTAISRSKVKVLLLIFGAARSIQVGRDAFDLV
jgi:transcription antitermination factor NusG